MVFLVRMDLKMGLGKMAAQVGHAVLGSYKQLDALSEKEQLAEHALHEWTETGQKKVVVKVNTEEELFKIIDEAHRQRINNYVVRDAGRTQVTASARVDQGWVGDRRCVGSRALCTTRQANWPPQTPLRREFPRRAGCNPPTPRTSRDRSFEFDLRFSKRLSAGGCCSEWSYYQPAIILLKNDRNWSGDEVQDSVSGRPVGRQDKHHQSLHLRQLHRQ